MKLGYLSLSIPMGARERWGRQEGRMTGPVTRAEEDSAASGDGKERYQAC